MNLYSEANNLLFSDAVKKSSNETKYQKIYMSDLYKILRSVFEWKV